MNRRKTTIKPHPNAPNKLVKLWRTNKCNYYQTAKQLNVAASWVWQLIKYGKEPKRLDLRKKLFLTRKKSPEELEKIRQERKRLKEEFDKGVEEYLRLVLEETRKE